MRGLYSYLSRIQEILLRNYNPHILPKSWGKFMSVRIHAAPQNIPIKAKLAPLLERGILWAWRFSCRTSKKSGAHKIGGAISGPRIAGRKITDISSFFFSEHLCSHPREHRKKSLANYSCIGFVPGGKHFSEDFGAHGDSHDQMSCHGNPMAMLMQGLREF